MPSPIFISDNVCTHCGRELVDTLDYWLGSNFFCGVYCSWDYHIDKRESQDEGQNN